MTSFQICSHRASLHCSLWGDDPDASVVWQKTYSFLSSQGIASETYRIASGIGNRRKHRDILKEMSPEEIRTEVSLDPTSGFTIPDGTGSRPQIISYSPTPLDGGFQSFSISSRDADKLPDDWYGMVCDISSMVSLVAAKAQVIYYSAWQNCEDIDRYAKQFGSTEHFKQYEKGDPPVNRMVLDTSTNPGRNQMKNGCPMGVSAEMWLGPAFWRFAPCKKEDVLAADFFLKVCDTPEFLYLKSWPHPFTRPDGEQGRVQQKLWRLLFHEDCEWPPGSGGISDEPIGGPPELMP